MNQDHPEGADLVQLATEMVAAAQSVGVQILEAELKALAQVMPGAAPQAASPSQAEVEAGFDNMPV